MISSPSFGASDSSLVLELGPRTAPGLGAENENEPWTVPAKEECTESYWVDGKRTRNVVGL